MIDLDPPTYIRSDDKAVMVRVAVNEYVAEKCTTIRPHDEPEAVTT